MTMKKNSSAFVALGLMMIVFVMVLLVTNWPSPSGSVCEPKVITDAPSKYVFDIKTPTRCSAPNGITTDSAGNVWFVEQNASRLAKYDMSSGNFTEYTLPVNHPITWGMAVTPDGDVWLTDANSSAIIRFDPGSGEFTQYALSRGSFPMQMVLGPEGSLWFTELYGHKIGVIKPLDGSLNEFDVDVGAGPTGLAFDSSGSLWIAMASFTQGLPSYLLNFDRTNASFKRYDMPFAIAQPTGVAVDDQGYVWLAEHGLSLLGRFDPRTGGLIEVATSAKAGLDTTLPYWLVKDEAGNIWFNEHYANRIGVLYPQSMVLKEVDIPSRVPTYGNISNALTIAADQRGNLWFTEWSAGKIGFVNASMLSDLDVQGPSEVNVKVGSNVALELEYASSHESAGPWSLEATDSEQGNGTILRLAATYALRSQPFVPPLNEAIQVLIGAADGTQRDIYTMTLTLRMNEVAVSKTIFVHLRPQL
jgi:virginiamycin B lyase